MPTSFAITESDIQRFNERYVVAESGCWLWSGQVRQTGYGVMRFHTTHIRAHRLSYRIHKGKIPDGLIVMHICDNKLCVNPDHLKVGTARENTIDMIRKGRHPFLPANLASLRLIGANKTSRRQKKLEKKMNPDDEATAE